MKKDIKYIIKRILIGVGIALALMFIKHNVYAVEINDLHAGNNTELIDYTTLGNIKITEVYNNYYNNQYIVPVYNETTHNITTPAQYSSSCIGISKTTSFNSNIGANEPYTIPADPKQTFLGSNYSCSNYSKHYLTLSTLILDFTNFTMEKDKYYKINMYFKHEYYPTNRLLQINHAINDPEDLKVKFPTNLEPYSMYYAFDNYNEAPYVSLQDKTSNYYNWLTISLIVHAVDDVVNPIIYFGYSPSDTLISGNSTYPSTFTDNEHLPLLTFNYTQDNSSFIGTMEVSGTRPFIYEYTVENPSIQIPDYYSDVVSDVEGIIGDINDGVYSGDNTLDFISGGGGGTSFGNHTFKDVFTLPIRFLQTLQTNTTCEPISINIPINNASITIPCMSTFFTNIFGDNLLSIIQLIIMGSIGLFLFFDLYDFILKISDPSGLLYYEDNIEYLDKRTGEVVSKKRRVVK